MSLRAMVGYGLILVAAIGTATLLSGAGAQPKRGVDVVRELRVPSVAYASIVICAYGGGPQATSYAAVLTNGREEFHVTVRGGETLILPFPGGWTPVDYTLKLNPEAPTFLVSAWGIQQGGGPVAFEKIGK